MAPKPNITLEIASALVHESNPEELEEIRKLIEEEIEERRRIGI